MKKILDIQTIASTHNTSIRHNTIEYIAVHYTAGYDSKVGKAKDNAKYYSVTTEKASADFFVDDGSIVQFNEFPEKRYCWAVGGTKADKSKGGGKFFSKAHNSNTISVEICSYNDNGPPPKGQSYEPNDPGYHYTNAALSKAAILVRYLMAEYEVPIDKVIRHFDVTGKICPGIIGWNEASGDTFRWLAFKSVCTEPLPSVERYDAIYQMPDWARPTIKKLCDQKILLGGEEFFDVNGRPADLDLSMDMIRILVINDRAGLYDKKDDNESTVIINTQ